MFLKTLVEKEFMCPIDHETHPVRPWKTLLWIVLTWLAMGGVCAAQPTGSFDSPVASAAAANGPELTTAATVESTLKNGDGEEDEDELEMEIDPLPVQGGSLAAPDDGASFSAWLRSLLRRLLPAPPAPRAKAHRSD